MDNVGSIESFALKANRYPSYLFAGIENAAFFFSAAFLGKQDAIYAKIYNVPEVFCVDQDEVKNIAMADIYPDHWKFITGDAYDLAVVMSPLQFDLVSLDPFSSQADRVLIDDFQLFWNLSRKHVACTVTKNAFLKKHDIRLCKRGLESFLNRQHPGLDIDVAELLPSGNFDGGSYLAIMRKHGN